MSTGSAMLNALDEALPAAVLLGAGLPEAARQHLHDASRSYHEDELAERHLREAQRLAPDHAAVLIGLYRFYFYKNRLRDALQIAQLCLRKAAVDVGLSAACVNDWRQVKPGEVDFSHYDAVLPRFYLFTLKGYAYLNLRLGNIDEGRAAVDKLLQLDPSDKLGAKVLLGVLERMDEPEEVE